MLKILTLNLHTYQEIDIGQEKNLIEFFEKYENIQEKIVQFIMDENIDIAVFQEAAQHRDMDIIEEKFGIKIKRKNYIKVLHELLLKKNKFYEYVWDFSHYGWNIWEEGLGILTKYPIVNFESKYISKTKDKFSIYSRKILKTTLLINNKLVDIYTVHLNWVRNGFENEYKKLINWINKSSNSRLIIAGDFNINAGTKDYEKFISMNVKGEKLTDVFYETNRYKIDEPTIRKDKFNDGGRIDYILVSKHFRAIDSRIVFKDNDKYGRVSDHMGLWAKLEIIE
ncbi:maltose 6'-phosphate phosphatase [Thermosipho japonicus]|uniref:Maltose 6'-phosphate phosphatase n=1 Tax=Thermosipho japonicus TaxID=90323 RepID=A0A841GQL3_9BACT|nr:endonuclease/exonuclease/phosphatase family protein [Thermosipho japonicus]MBB6061919.1 maltose 6'-phosphate phosphatase [Thermosipho japonicus]